MSGIMSRCLPKSSRDQPCNLCGATEFEIVAKTDRKRQPLVTVICTHCGLLCHEVVPTADALRQYYARQYRAAYQGEYTPSAYRVLREWYRGRDLVRLLRPYMHADDRIMEIGSGIGCTVRNLMNAGYQAVGIEPGRGFREFALQQLGADVRDMMLDDVPTDARVDFVLLVHVLEHLRDPAASLRHIHALLSDRGRLYVEIPNAGAPHAAPGKMFHFAHIYNFTRATLQALAIRAGFEPVHWLGRDDDRNLRLLLQRTDHADGAAHAIGDYAQTRAALGRYTTVTYHLRWRYLIERCGIIAHHAGNRVLAKYRLRRLLDSLRVTS